MLEDNVFSVDVIGNHTFIGLREDVLDAVGEI